MPDGGAEACDESPQIFVKTDLSNPPDTWNRLEDQYPDLPTRLNDLGIDGVEVALRGISGHIEQNADMLREFEEWAAAWHEAGMVVHPHPYTTGEANPGQFFGEHTDCGRAAFEQVAEVSESFAQTMGHPLQLTYHPAEATGEDRPERDELLTRSRRFFEMTDDVLADLEAPVRVVSETQLPANRDGSTIRSGDIPSEVIQVAEGHDRVGICWDTGHYILSSQRLGAPETPPDELASQVRHMHLHDVVDDVDHRAPTPGSERLTNAILRAVAQGRLQSVTLEYDYRRAVDDPGNIEGMLSHIEDTTRWIREVTASVKHPARHET